MGNINKRCKLRDRIAGEQNEKEIYIYIYKKKSIPHPLSSL